MCAEWFKAFQQSQQGEGMWRELKSNTKLLEQLHNDVTRELEVINGDDFGAMARITPLHHLTKKLYAAQKIITSMYANGEYNDQVFADVEEMKLYLSLEPITALELPDFLKKQCHEHAASKSKPEAFWVFSSRMLSAMLVTRTTMPPEMHR